MIQLSDFKIYHMNTSVRIIQALTLLTFIPVKRMNEETVSDTLLSTNCRLSTNNCLLLFDPILSFPECLNMYHFGNTKD